MKDNNTNLDGLSSVDPQLQGYADFLNIYLFQDLNAPELCDDNFYRLGEFTSRQFLDPAAIEKELELADWGMRSFENILKYISLLGKFKQARKDIIQSYMLSPAKTIINELIAEQEHSYYDCTSPIDLNDEDISFAFIETTIIPIHVQAFLSNHFSDLYKETDVLTKKISKEHYGAICNKYVRHQSLDEIQSNIHRGIHCQTSKDDRDILGEGQNSGFIQYRLQQIKLRVKE